MNHHAYRGYIRRPHDSKTTGQRVYGQWEIVQTGDSEDAVRYFLNWHYPNEDFSRLVVAGTLAPYEATGREA